MKIRYPAKLQKQGQNGNARKTGSKIWQHNMLKFNRRCVSVCEMLWKGRDSNASTTGAYVKRSHCNTKGIKGTSYLFLYGQTVLT